MSEKVSTTASQWFSVLSDAACKGISTIGELLNSNFSTALLGSLAGAYAGAYIAQKISENKKDSDELLKEIRNTNAAIMMSFVACNTALILKSQFTHPLCARYKQDLLSLEEFLEQKATGQRQGNAAYEFTADLKEFSCPTISLGALKDLIFNNMSASGRALAVVIELDQSVKSLESAFKKRTQFIQGTLDGRIPEDKLPHLYFGKPDAAGNINREYHDTILAIESSVDAAIFFSSLLCRDLTAHNEKLKVRYVNKFKKSAPKINKGDFSEAEKIGLMPKETDYQDWLSGFPLTGDDA